MFPHAQRSHAPTALVAALLLTAALAGQPAQAQGLIDRSPLDFPVRPGPGPGGPSPMALLPSTGPTRDTLFTWFVSPTLVAVDSTRGYGIGAGIVTSRLIPGLPIGLSVSDRYITVGGEGNNRLQFDLQFMPRLPIPRTSLLIRGHHRTTADVSSSQQGYLELDVSLVERKSGSLYVGGMLYYDRQKPLGAGSQSGATFGATSGIQIRRLVLVGEYDFKNGFKGGDDYSVVALYTLPVNRRMTGLQGMVGYAKGKVWIFGLKAAFLGPVRTRA